MISGGSSSGSAVAVSAGLVSFAVATDTAGSGPVPTACNNLMVLVDPIKLDTNLGYYTNFTKLLDLVAIAIPSAFTANGFPVGVTLIGPPWRDAHLASFVSVLHRRANLPLGATGIRLPD